MSSSVNYEEMMMNLGEDGEKLLEHYKKVGEMVKEMKKSEREEKERDRFKVKSEKEEAARNRITVVIEKIHEKDPSVKLMEEGSLCEKPMESFLEGSSVTYLKEWVKEYRASVKKTKEDLMASKLSEKEERLSKLSEKADVKREKQRKQMEKMESDLEKWNDKMEFEVVSFQEKLDKPSEYFSEMKTYYTRVKLLMQLAKFNETVEGIPEYDVMEITDDKLKEIHTRSKLLNQLHTLQGGINNFDYDADRDNAALKCDINEKKNT